MGSKKKKPNKVGADSENGRKKEIQMIEDPRFSMIHTDPRYQRIPKKTDKISIDSRFTQIFTDKQFASSSAKVDKRGKPKKQTENGLRRFYHLEDEVKNNEKKKTKSVVKRVEDESEGNSNESLASESSGESSESDLEGDSETDDASLTTDSDEADDVDVSEDDESVEVETVPVIESETHRLAVVNMDWNQVKAVDIFMMLRSFLPKEGQIKSVAVYPSEFGLKRMEEEAVRGPVALLGDEKKKDDEGLDDDDDDDDDEEDEIDTEKLRAYEKSRLRYYFAVVECDSIATADYLYKACDGVEFERSSNVLDLRFIPDSMEFAHPPRDVAKEAPVDYEGLDFQTRALQQSNVTLSWDDDEPHRVKTLRRKFNDNQLAELELKEFLASDESDSSDGDESEDVNEDEDEDESEDVDKDSSDKVNKKARKTKLKAKMAKKDMYRALIQSGDGSEEDEDEGKDMEVTFNTGLEDISKKILEKKDKGSETVWEAYLRKKKEKKKARKYRSKNSSDDESDESDEEPLEQTEDFFEEVCKSKKVTHSKKKREEQRPLEDEEKAASTAELELLLADEKGANKNLKGYKIKQKMGKGKKGKETPDEDKLPTVDYDDPRFSAIFTNPAFSLDPTDPQFKRSATYFRQLAQRQRNDREENATIDPVEPSRLGANGSSRNEDGNSVGTSRKEKFELSSIVKSIKMKSQQLPKPSSVKMKKDKTEHGSTLKVKKHKLEGVDHKMKKKARV